MQDIRGWTEQVNQLVEALRDFQARNLFNQWEETAQDYDCVNAAAIRRSNLRAYLLARPRPRYVFIGEAPSWRGTRFSGIPMTSERILLGGHPVRSANDVIPGATGRRTSRPEVNYPHCSPTKELAERSATKMWKAALAQDLAATDFVLWNAMPWHPHNEGSPCSNRANRNFTLEEEKAGRQFLTEVLRGLYPSARSVALGEYGARQLLKAEYRAVPHPSERRGAFERGLAGVLSVDAAGDGGDGITLAMNRVCEAVGERRDYFREVATRHVLERVEW